jgi:hypothetical protein
MTNALALIQPNEYDLMMKLAGVAAKSGYTGKNEMQAMFIMLKGSELGISPLQALDGITIIQNKPTVSPQLMLALINRSGELEDMQINGDATQCTVMMKRKGRSPHTEQFTMQNAGAMGLSGKDNWKKQPAVMLKWRAVSACARIVFPDVIQGMYTPEEMGAEVSESEGGEIIIEVPQVATPVIPLNADVETGEIIDAVGTENVQSDEKVSEPTEAVETSEKPVKAVWEYDFQALMKDARIGAAYPVSQHRAGAIQKLHEGGYFNVAQDYQDAVAVVLTRPDKVVENA